MAVPVIAALGKFLSNPEVLEKVCGIVPEISEDLTKIALSYPDLMKETEKLNQQNMDAYNAACGIVLDTCKKIVEKDEITTEDRKYFVDVMLQIVNGMGVKTSENKRSTKDNLRMAGEFLLLGPFGFASEALYRKSKSKKLSKNDEEN